MPVVIGTPQERAEQEVRVFHSSYIMTKKELRRAAAAREKYRFSLTAKLAMKIIGAPLALVCVCALIILRQSTHEFAGMFMSMYALFLIVALVLLFHKTLFVFFQGFRRDLKKIIGQTIESDVTVNGVRSDFFGSSATLPWKGFRKSGMTKHGLLLTLESGVFLWLPITSFATPEDWENVREMARQRMKR